MEHYHLETLQLRLRSPVYETRAAAEEQQRWLESALGPMYRVVACTDALCRAADVVEEAERDAAWREGNRR